MRNVVVLAGGVGAARFIRGLVRCVDPRCVTIVGNTGDDEEFFGLHVAPDLDTVLYTLAGRVDPRHGWGVAGDTFHTLDAVRALRGPTWFRLGDVDLATHLVRTRWLRDGVRLSGVTARLAEALGVESRLLPMTDDRVRTFVYTERGRLPFQRYLVEGRARGRVRRIEIAGAGRARPAPGVLTALRAAGAIIIAPSNPLVSVAPILAVRGVRAAIRRRRRRVVAISPLVAGRPVKGPLHRMLSGLGLEVSARGVARCYRGLANTFVLDRADAALAPGIEALGMRVLVADTLMASVGRAARLAGVVLAALGRRP